MKHVFKLVFALFMGIGVSLSLNSYASASQIETQTAPLSEYEEILNKLSKEYGVEFYINPEKKDYFYDRVKNMSIEEFEKKQREQYQEYLKQDLNDTNSKPNSYSFIYN
ncbi:hypothetical protein ACH0B5_11055 [Ureibacillus sp. 179-F W5.1 NHS]|uniref:DUF2680 domain-containing protein n=1 Tax=Lysinibacillus halotolerans TaxID=1368476 RepID=A0A3M8HB96_9BACI|nr:hypothetical protein [Lysinibacillus halotolerans]RNC99578.1 hypothetical protein EC501_07470 [Lysinibacillus halotolerans]